MSDINDLRNRMDEVTLEMIKLLKTRTDIAKEIGEVKKNIGKGVTDEIREDNVDVFTCRPKECQAGSCIALYFPVCGKVNVQCITAPCDPVEETFSNSCFACMNPLVESYVAGECQ